MKTQNFFVQIFDFIFRMFSMVLIGVLAAIVMTLLGVNTSALSRYDEIAVALVWMSAGFAVSAIMRIKTFIKQ